MKRTAAALLLWCAGIAAHAQKNITISGTITGHTDPKLIVVNATNTNIIPENKQETFSLSDDGKFSISLPVTQKYNWIVMVNGNRRLDFFVKEGSALTLSAQGNSLDTSAHFEGNGSEIPEYFAIANRERGGIMGYYRRTQEIAAADPAQYKRVLDSVKTAEETIFKNTRIKGKELPKDFAAYWSVFLEYSVYDAMLHYPVMHEMIRQRTQHIQNIPRELYEVTKKTPKIFKDEYLDVPFYQTYVQSYYKEMLTAAGFQNEPPQAEAGQDKMGQQTDSVFRLIYANMPRKTGEFAAGRMIATESKGWPAEGLDVKVAEYKKQYPKSSNNIILEKFVADLRKFNPGQPAVDFTFKTLEGKDMKLSDLKGKVVYMDFWASWCGPCKGEMPHAKKIKEHFQGKDVVFLYVSIDEKEEAWKRGIEAMSISGIHTRTPGWKGEIAELYQIQSVPAYFLIDKKGKFVSDRTPRPSQSEELIKLIEGLL